MPGNPFDELQALAVGHVNGALAVMTGVLELEQTNAEVTTLLNEGAEAARAGIAEIEAFSPPGP